MAITIRWYSELRPQRRGTRALRKPHYPTPLDAKTRSPHVQGCQAQHGIFPCITEKIWKVIRTISNVHYLCWSNQELPICPLSRGQNKLTNQAISGKIIVWKRKWAKKTEWWKRMAYEYNKTNRNSVLCTSQLFCSPLWQNSIVFQSHLYPTLRPTIWFQISPPEIGISFMVLIDIYKKFHEKKTVYETRLHGNISICKSRLYMYIISICTHGFRYLFGAVLLFS